MKIIKFYKESCFKVEYNVNEWTIDFKAWEIDALDEQNIEQSEIQSQEPVINGYMKFDGCCEFDYSTHYCGIHDAEKFLLLMKDIYQFKENNK
jgi:hypothetical protein